MKKLCAIIGAFFVVSGIAVVTAAVIGGSRRFGEDSVQARARGRSSVVLEAAVVRHPMREAPSRPR